MRLRRVRHGARGRPMGAMRGDAPVDPGSSHRFRKLTLSTEFTCEGASHGDFDCDGVQDVVAGPYWYAGPTFAARHRLYPPVVFDPKGYSDCFFAFVRDFNSDGWDDVLVVGFPGQAASWLENPEAARRRRGLATPSRVRRRGQRGAGVHGPDRRRVARAGVQQRRAAGMGGARCRRAGRAMGVSPALARRGLRRLHARSGRRRRRRRRPRRRARGDGLVAAAGVTGQRPALATAPAVVRTGRRADAGARRRRRRRRRRHHLAGGARLGPGLVRAARGRPPSSST